MPAVICAGVEVLTRVKVPNWPGARAVPELFCHMMELKSRMLPQPREFAALVGLEGRLFPKVVQPYQKLLRFTEPVFSKVIV